MTVLADRGISVDIPSGWDAEMYQRPAEEGETTNGIVHIANFALPQGRGDYGGGATKLMGSGAILIVLFEFDPELGDDPAVLQRQRSRGPCGPDQFDPNTLQRPLPGQGGCQIFCNEAGRAFCLYVVLGGYSRRTFLLRSVNAVLGTLRIEPLEPLDQPEPAATAEPAAPVEPAAPSSLQRQSSLRRPPNRTNRVNRTNPQRPSNRRRRPNRSNRTRNRNEHTGVRPRLARYEKVALGLEPGRVGRVIPALQPDRDHPTVGIDTDLDVDRLPAGSDFTTACSRPEPRSSTMRSLPVSRRYVSKRWLLEMPRCGRHHATRSDLEERDMADDTQSDSPGQDADPTTTEDQADDAEATVAVAVEDEHGATAAAAVFVDDDEDGADAADDTVVVAAVEHDTSDAETRTPLTPPQPTTGTPMSPPPPPTMQTPTRTKPVPRTQTPITQQMTLRPPPTPTTPTAHPMTARHPRRGRPRNRRRGRRRR